MATISRNHVGQISFCRRFRNVSFEKKFLFAVSVILIIGGILSVLIGFTAYGTLHGWWPGTCIISENQAIVCIASGLTSIVGGAGLNFLLKINRLRLNHTFTDTEEYGFRRDAIWIPVYREHVNEHPDYHLNEFARMISQHAQVHPRAKIGVKFKGEEGVDQGGLSREYLDNMISALISKKCIPFKMIQSSSLWVPEIEDPDEDKLSLCRKLGMILMYCYYGKLPIGLHLDHSIFNVVLSLNAVQINTLFDLLTPLEKNELYYALLDGQEDKDYEQLLLLLALACSEWNEEQLKQAADFAQDYLPDSFLKDSEIDWDKCKKFPKGVKVALQKLASEYFDPQIRAIHAIARGMKSVCVLGRINPLYDDIWDARFCNKILPKTFSLQLQGDINRKVVVERILIKDNEIENKGLWLKEWILDETTKEEEIKRFLKLASGSTGIPPDLYIELRKPRDNYTLPFPRFHTCNSPNPFIELSVVESSETEKETFINCIKSLILKNSEDYKTFLLL